MVYRQPWQATDKCLLWEQSIKMASTQWETPQAFFDGLNEEFHFTLDLCASPENHKTERYYKANEDTLDNSTYITGETVWMNPPYDKDLWKWVRMAYRLSRCNIVVLLMPANKTDQSFWHEWAIQAAEIRYVIGRLHFVKNGRSSRANHPSVVLVFRPGHNRYPCIFSIDTKGNLVSTGVNYENIHRIELEKPELL